MLRFFEFIRYKILYHSSLFRFLERKLRGRETYTPFEQLIGMVSNEERNYCYSYAKNQYTGNGELVDLGSWLGSSVIPLAAGLKENKQAGRRKIHAYDAFQWYENMTESARLTPIRGKYKVGDNFRTEFEKRVAPYKEFIEIHEGDILVQKWNGKPIEYLMIDIMKNWELALHVVKEFYPSLIPGKGFVVHQDFCHNYTSWIHMIHYRLREYFEPVQNIRHSGSMVYRNTKQIPPFVSEIPDELSSFTNAEVEAAFDYSLSLVQPENKAAVMAAKVMMYRHLGNYAEARRQINEIPSRYKLLSYDLRETETVLNNEEPRNN